MQEILKEKLEKIAKKKQGLLERERLIKEKEREKEKKQRAKQSIEIGKLACKANIDAIDKEVLLGAFLEISQRVQKSNQVEKWKSEAINFLNSGISADAALSVSFQTEVNPEIKIKMKNLGFRWNKFRKEFYGYGRKHELEAMLNDVPCKVEVL